MAIRIGDLLLQEGVITSAELEEGLKCQVIFGGKLGTNLIELGVVKEIDISRALGRKFGVPAANLEELLQVPPEVVAALPRELAEKHGVMPVRLNRRRLSLAMTDPADLKVVDEIAFRTGCIIQPLAAAELCIVFALEKAYGIPRSRRYINITPPRQKVTISSPPPLSPYREPVLDLEQLEKEVLAHRPTIDFSKLAEPDPEPFPVPSKPASLTPFPSPPPAAMPRRAAPPAAARPATVPTPPPAMPAPPAAPAVEAAAAEVPASVSEQLIAARSRDEILDTLAACLGGKFPHAAVFLVRGETAMGWKCTIEGKPLAGFERVEIPLGEPSVLQTVADSRGFHLGPIPRTPFNSMLLQEMGGRVPEWALLVPLLMIGRVVAVLYVDAPGVNLGPYLVQLQKLTAKAAMAFEILVLQNKIISL